MQELRSKEDKSVNFVDDGYFESRYVRRDPTYFNCYLSSQNACNQGCRFCHLTATKQTSEVYDARPWTYWNQARQVMDEYERAEGESAKYVHYSFMARGEALVNQYLLDDSTYVLHGLGRIAQEHDLIPKFCISTIMPQSFKQNLHDVFPLITPTIYYSLYSVDPEWRKRWMPQAMPVKQALDLLKDYQIHTKKIVKIHGSFIKNQNDKLGDVAEMCQALADSGMALEFNLVAYNPYSPEYGEETDPQTLREIIYELNEIPLMKRVKLIKRVGFDVKASCGMFVEKEA